MQFDIVDFVVDSKIATYAFNSNRQDESKFGHIITTWQNLFLHILQTLGWSLIGDKQIWLCICQLIPQFIMIFPIVLTLLL